MARIHNVKKRMPVILPQNQWDQWLLPSLSKEQIIEMLHPCPDTNMNAYTISKLITTRGSDTNVPDIYKSFSYPELSSGEQTSLFDVHG
jgi:putative SOS response-associated peptidase YedK